MFRHRDRPWVRWTAGLALGLAVALALPEARAQSGESGYAGDTIVLKGKNGEFFVGGLPAGWRQIPGRETRLIFERRWIPANQDPSTVRDAIVFQSLPGEAGKPSETFFRQYAQSYRERCPNLLATEFKPAAFANGFDDISVILACPENTETATGEVTLFRAIGGAGSFYLIQRGWQLPPFPPERIPVSGQQFDAATKAIEFGYACEIGNGSRPCPAGWEGVLSSLDSSTSGVVFPAGN